jgi:hypothetical protein
MLRIPFSHSIRIPRSGAFTPLHLLFPDIAPRFALLAALGDLSLVISRDIDTPHVHEVPRKGVLRDVKEKSELLGGASEGGVVVRRRGGVGRLDERLVGVVGRTAWVGWEKTGVDDECVKRRQVKDERELEKVGVVVLGEVSARVSMGKAEGGAGGEG